MNPVVLPISAPTDILAYTTGEREELVRRVAASITFQKSPRLRAFFLHVCRCALDNKPEEATEQQIGIHVYGRLPGYNPNEDNIVRSQARVLRMKLEHHFTNEGKYEPVVISIPKGRYLPVFETRSEVPGMPIPVVAPTGDHSVRLKRFAIPLAVLLGLALLWIGHQLIEKKAVKSPSLSVLAESITAPGSQESQPSTRKTGVVFNETGEVRIAAGHTGAPYTDVWGHRWEADRYYEGGAIEAGPRRFFPPVADEGFLSSMRQAVSTDIMVPETERQFRYDIPVESGTYELRLYFADPLRETKTEKEDDAQNNRHFQINLNGTPLLTDFDPIADAGSAAVDVRAFKDVRPAQDGRLHLQFAAGWGAPPFVNAIELSRGIPGRLRPIRITSRPSDFVDADGNRWSGDDYFVGGRTWLYQNPKTGPKIPPLYTGERHGNFSYAIPVPPGNYTVKLHFLESFFNPLIPAAPCHGVGCRIFDVACNGVMLLQNFDIFQAAGGAFKPIVREFHGLHPNGQGKLLLSFSPRVNYAEVRAIEVIDEGK